VSQVRLLITIERDELNRVSSKLEPASEEDYTTLQLWPGGGYVHMAHALMQEAVYTEALVEVLLQASRNADFLPTWQRLSEKEKASLLRQMSAGLQEVVRGFVARIAESQLRGALSVLSSVPEDRNTT
jgi:hypothetical protein